MLHVNQLVGFGAVPAGLDALASLALFNSAVNHSTSTPITVPNGVREGDLLVFLEHDEISGATPVNGVPSGFTQIDTRSGNYGGGAVNVIVTLSYKIAAGTESATTLQGIDHLYDQALYIFRGNGTSQISSVTVGSAQGQVTTGNPTAQNVAASAGVAPLVVIGSYNTSGTLDPRTMSPAKDGEITPSTQTYLAYKIYNSSPADVSVDMDDEGSLNILQSCYLQIS